MTELEQSVFQLILKSKGNCVYESIDSPSTIVPPDEETVIMAQHLIEFLREEVKV